MLMSRLDITLGPYKSVRIRSNNTEGGSDLQRTLTTAQGVGVMVEHYSEELKKSGLGLNLHEYQILGIKHVLQWYSEKHGGIIADEMGLGKTCQAVGAIVCLLNVNKAGRHMVICPLSVLQHWQNELFRFGLGKLRIITYIGNAEARRVIREKLHTSEDWNVLVTTYEIVISDEHYFHWTWSSLFIDEAHRLKSRKSVLHQIVRKMSVEFMVLMTGTPMQNNINELYSLLSLIDSNRFSLLDEEQFVDKYRNIPDTAAELHHVLSKYLIRRTKQILHINIPHSSEVIVYHGITEMQKNMYRAILSKNYKYFENVGDTNTQHAGNRMSLLNVLMQLRKCVAHPYLFDGVELEPFKEGDHLFEVSGKFLLLDRLLEFLSAKGHRVLIFSQMTRVLDIVQDYLVYKGYNYRRLDGSVRAEERFAAVNRFQTNSDIFCFLLSTRAGGLGLNLTAGDTVIFLDSDFNPQNDIQAAARCHRIGQTRPVKIIRLVSRYTVEDMIQCRAARKLQLTQAILEEKRDDGKELTFAEISDLIIKGLNRLNNEKSGFEKLNMEDIEKLIGRTDENGHWVHGEEQIVSSERANSKENESDILENMYIFEGHDYKQDVAVLQNILDTYKTVELVGDVSAEQNVSVERRTRKPISKEEMEKRIKKRKETLELKKRLMEEKNERKRKEQERKKNMKWLENNYQSGCLPLREIHEVKQSDSNINFGPHFVYGSVTDTVKTPGDNSDHAVIVHVVDNSGLFGHGGVFDALRRKSQQIINTYELAGKMDDLHLGDAHLIKDIADEPPATILKRNGGFRDNGDFDEAGQSTSEIFPSRKISVVLLVAQHRHRRDVINQDILSKCLKRLAFYAVNANVSSVHMPRIGYDMRNISWYAVERLITRILVSKGIHTYIYYFKRANNTNRNGNKRSDSGEEITLEKKSRIDDKTGSDFEKKAENMELEDQEQDGESDALFCFSEDQNSRVE